MGLPNLLGKGVKNGIFRFRAKEKTANDMAKPTVPGSKHRHVYISPARLANRARPWRSSLTWRA